MPDKEQRPVNMESVAREDSYRDDAGRQIFVFTRVFAKKAKPVIVGEVVVGRITPNGQQQIPLRWQFPEGTSLKDAFTHFDESGRKAVDRFQKQQLEAARVVAAKTMPQIMGPDGKPIGG